MIKNNIQKVETYLPIFSGFYNTIWQFEDDNMMYTINQDREREGKKPIEWDMLEIDYTAYENDIVEAVCNSVAENLKPFIQSIKLQQIISPKEYNFKNDSANIEMLADIEAIRQYVYNNIDKYKEFLKERYTGCDGYIPYYSNCFDEWKEYTKDFSDFTTNGHYLGSVLEFIAYNEGIGEYEIYNSIDDMPYSENYILNYDEVLTK